MFFFRYNWKPLPFDFTKLSSSFTQCTQQISDEPHSSYIFNKFSSISKKQNRKKKKNNVLIRVSKAFMLFKLFTYHYYLDGWQYSVAGFAYYSRIPENSVFFMF